MEAGYWHVHKFENRIGICFGGLVCSCCRFQMYDLGIIKFRNDEAGSFRVVVDTDIRLSHIFGDSELKCI